MTKHTTRIAVVVVAPRGPDPDPDPDLDPDLDPDRGLVGHGLGHGLGLGPPPPLAADPRLDAAATWTCPTSTCRGLGQPVAPPGVPPNVACRVARHPLLGGQAHRRLEVRTQVCVDRHLRRVRGRASHPRSLRTER